MKSKREKLTWDAEAGVAANVRRQLPKLAGAYFQAGRKAVLRADDLDALHRFRLRTKRFRYTLELFRPLYGPGLEQRIKALRRIQQYLGDINDCAATRRLVGEAAGARGRHIQRLLRMLDARIADKTKALRSYWRGEFDLPGESRRWINYLAVYPGRRKAAGLEPALRKAGQTTQ